MKKLKFAKNWKWATMDRDECWYFWQGKEKPICIEHDGMWATMHCNLSILVSDEQIFEPVKDWRKSLIRINK